MPEQPQLAQADYGSEKELSSKDLRKAGVSWDNVDIESDQELLQFTRGRDIFTLPNPGTSTLTHFQAAQSPRFRVPQQTAKEWWDDNARNAWRTGQMESISLLETRAKLGQVLWRRENVETNQYTSRTQKGKL